MKHQKLIDKFLKIDQQLYSKAKDPLKCHDVRHHLQVCQYALSLAEDLKLKYDPEVLIPACLFHDLSGFFPKISQEEHHIYSCKLAKKELEKIGYPQEKIEKIMAVISRHGTDHKPKDGQERIEATLLRDADKIETAGPLGIARIIMAETRRGRSLEEITKKWIAKIDKKVDAITFERTKKMVAKDYKYNKQFFVTLNNQLNNGQFRQPTK